MDTGYANTQYCAGLSFWDFLFEPKCFGQSRVEWQQQAIMQPPPVGAPSESVWTTPPSSGEEADATVGGVISSQMVQWQQSNTNSVQPVNTYIPDTINNLITGNVDPSSAVNWTIVFIGLVGVAALSLLGGRH